jgi:hypothetical protein
LTDLAGSELTQFYGREDLGTLQNLLFHVPNIVPVPTNAATAAAIATAVNNNADDDKTLQQQRKNNGNSPSLPLRTLQSIPEDEDATGQDRVGVGGASDGAAPEQNVRMEDVQVVVHCDENGGYVNVAADIDDAEETGSATGSAASTAAADAAATDRSLKGNVSNTSSMDSVGNRRLIRQKHVMCEDGDTGVAPAAAAAEAYYQRPTFRNGDGSQSSTMSSSSSDEEFTAHTTLHKFLEMIKKRPSSDLLNGGDATTNTRKVRN